MLAFMDCFDSKNLYILQLEKLFARLLEISPHLALEKNHSIPCVMIWCLYYFIDPRDYPQNHSLHSCIHLAISMSVVSIFLLWLWLSIEWIGRINEPTLHLYMKFETKLLWGFYYGNVLYYAAWIYSSYSLAKSQTIFPFIYPFFVCIG